MRVEGKNFRVEGQGSWIRVWGLKFGLGVEGIGFRFSVFGFSVQGSGFRVENSRFQVQGVKLSKPRWQLSQ